MVDKQYLADELVKALNKTEEEVQGIVDEIEVALVFNYTEDEIEDEGTELLDHYVQRTVESIKNGTYEA